MIRLHSVRYGVPVESEHETVEEAVRAASSEIKLNTAAPDYLTDEQGEVFMDAAALRRAIHTVALTDWELDR